MKRTLAVLAVCLSAAHVDAQTIIEMKPRVVQSDSPTRRTDLNFQMAATSGLSVAQVSGNYYLFGAYLAASGAWNHLGTDMLNLVFPDNANPDWCYRGQPAPCDPSTPPLQRDARCGDNVGVVWKSTGSSVPSWLYQNFTTGASTRVATNPSVGEWPRQWPNDCNLTGAAGWKPVISAAAINAAIPNPVKAASPGGCGRDLTDALSFATGAADPKVVNVNGKWYMAFSETINNPQNNGWTPGDLFLAAWAVSDDGKSWTIRRHLFRTTHEKDDCSGGLLVTQLIVDNNYFYLLLSELWHAGQIMLRAPINQANADGFGQWQIAAHGPDPNHYLWLNTPANGFLDTAALNAYSLFPVPSVVQQGAMARVHSSPVSGSPSRIVAVSNRYVAPNTPDLLQIWSTPDLDTPFTFQSTIDMTFLKPQGGNGWEPAFTVSANGGTSTPTNTGKEFDFWLIGNFWQTGQNLDGHTRHVTAYRMTTTLSGDIYSPRAALRTAGGYYVGVTAGTVSATQTSIVSNARFVFPKSGNTLASNEAVTLVARNGNYLSAINGGGAGATATPNAAGANETFTIVRVNGAGTIVNGDAVALRSANGRYLTAQNGGGGTVDFTATAINANSTFIYTIAS